MSKMSEMDIEVSNICPGTPERPIRGSEHTFKNLRGEWIEQVKLGTDGGRGHTHRVILSHGNAFNRHGGLYTKCDTKHIYEELREIFTPNTGCRVFDIEMIASGPNKGKCALLDIPDMRSMGRRDVQTWNGRPISEEATEYHVRHDIIKAWLPAQPYWEEIKYDIFALPSSDCVSGRVNTKEYPDISLAGAMYEDMKSLSEKWEDMPYEGVVLKKRTHTYKWNQKDTSEWIKVRYK